jgi:tRNA A-37 threonylcarbamoyl transferase component Bud32
MVVIDLTQNTPGKINIIDLTETPKPGTSTRNHEAPNNKRKKKSNSSIESGEIRVTQKPNTKKTKPSTSTRNHQTPNTKQKKKSNTPKPSTSTRNHEAPNNKRKKKSNSSIESGEIRVTQKPNTKKTKPSTVSPPYETGTTEAFPESRIPILHSKYKNMILDGNSIHRQHTLHVNNTIPDMLAYRLVSLIKYSTKVGQGSRGHVSKIPYSTNNKNNARTHLDIIFKIIEEQPQRLTRLFRRPDPGTAVVIKRQVLAYPSNTGMVKAQLKDLNNEALIMESLHDLPFVPQLYATIYDKTIHTFYFFMEYVNGTPLGDILRRTTVRNKQRLHDIYTNLNKALIQIWKRGVLHMDLHRDNILVHSDNSVTIIDFGLAHKTKRVENIASVFRTTNDARVLWKKHLERYANALIIKAGYKKFYNPNSKILPLLQELHNKYVNA